MSISSSVKIVRCFRHHVAELYRFCLAFPELKVSSTSEFMTPKELDFSVTSTWSVIRVAIICGRIVGFCLGTIGDPDTGGYPTHACIVYLAVAPHCRKCGIGSQLLKEVVDSLRAKGVTYIYTWACPTSGMVEVCARAGMVSGRTCQWMDMAIAADESR